MSQENEAVVKLSESWTLPRSMCECGHNGDGPNSQHADTKLGTKGYGHCLICDHCHKFRWKKFTTEFSQVLKKVLNRAY